MKNEDFCDAKDLCDASQLNNVQKRTAVSA